MYLDHFGFSQKPFSIAPNPQFLYMSPRHREALAHLIYGLSGEGGFVILTGEVGTGKTTLCRSMITQLPEHVDTAFILNPTLTVPELLATICDEFGIDYPAGASQKVLGDRINTFLLSSARRDRKAVLIIDEAQNLSVNVLEQLRLLTNLETNEEKLLQIILLGQEELIDLLGREELRQLEQRVTARFHLTALSSDESSAYIAHRLQTAGGDAEFFSQRQRRYIHRKTRGIPRLINVVCDRALLGAYAKGVHQMSMGIVRTAVREALADPRLKRARPLLPWVIAGVAVAALVAVLTAVQPQLRPAETASTGTPPSDNRRTTADQNRPNDPPANPVEATPEPGPPPAPAAELRQTPEPASIATLSPVQTPNVAPPTPQLLSFNAGDSSLGGLTGHFEEVDAFVPLFAVWGTDYDPAQAEPCVKAVTVGLRCLRRPGSLEDVVKLNRPAILRLGDDAGYVTLMFIEGAVASITDQDGSREVRLDSLEAAWQGEYILLWRMPPAYTAPVHLGDSGAAVDWLTYQLDLMDGRAARLSADSRFDAALEARVRALQEANGILVDGIAGAETWIAINAFEGLGVPFLSATDS